MIRTKTLATAAALTLGAMLMGAGMASAQQVSTNYDQTVNFSQFTTYNWVLIQGATYPNSLQDAQIRAAIDSALKMKGMTKVDSGGQVYVGYQISTQDQKQWNGYSSGGGRWGGMGGMGSVTSETIEIGTLAVDIYDPAKQQLIWQATATKQLNPSSNAQKNQANLQKAVNKMFEKYPPGAQQKKN